MAGVKFRGFPRTASLATRLSGVVRSMQEPWRPTRIRGSPRAKILKDQPRQVHERQTGGQPEQAGERTAQSFGFKQSACGGERSAERRHQAGQRTQAEATTERPTRLPATAVNSACQQQRRGEGEGSRQTHHAPGKRCGHDELVYVDASPWPPLFQRKPAGASIVWRIECAFVCVTRLVTHVLHSRPFTVVVRRRR